ncbi:MAG: hypothetical protein RLY70_3765 [Planctomycetota bacterium]|jgi:uncharacterized membrane protein YozB (DUF420 family)
MEKLAQILPHVNASLNALATVLLIVGWRLIRQRRESAHRRVMLSAFAVSTVFLGSYLLYHFGARDGASTPFPPYPPAFVRYAYYAILLSHILLAMAVPFMAVASIYLGLRGYRSAHRRLARWTFPIWLYVSVTGVVVYVMLYQVFPPQQASL